MSTYAFSDLHGNRELFEQIKKFLKSEDLCYVLGDIFDRGTDGWNIFKEMICDKRFIILKGNHEDMFVKAANSFENGNYNDDTILYVEWNNDSNTIEQWSSETFRKQWLREVRNLPTLQTYVNTFGKKIILTHAGFSFNQKKRNYLWDRTHYLKQDSIPDDIYIVHGHTPIPLMIEDMKFFDISYNWNGHGVCWYNNNHKVNIDGGTAWTNEIALLDLDTFENYYF